MSKNEFSVSANEAKWGSGMRLSVGGRFQKNHYDTLRIGINKNLAERMGWDNGDKVDITFNEEHTMGRITLSEGGRYTLSANEGSLRVFPNFLIPGGARHIVSRPVDFSVVEGGDIVFHMPSWAHRSSAMMFVPESAGPVLPFGEKRRAMLEAYDRSLVE